MLEVTRISGGFMTAFALMLIVFGESFLELWIGPEVADAYIPLVILSLASVVMLTEDFASKVLQASHLHRLVADLGVGTMVANLVLSLTWSRSSS